MAVATKSVGSFYLVGAFLIPTEAERIEGKKKVIILPPTFIVADDDQAAHSQAILRVPRDVELDPDRIEVFVALPFGR